MHVNIILNPNHGSWIIEKMAQRVVDYAPELGFSAAISNAPDEQADINHWMSYAFVDSATKSPSTVFITHIDDAFKLAYVKKALQQRVDIGICMSSYAVAELSARGLPRDSLCYVLPGHDSQVTPRKIVIGLTTRLYEDGRKREALLLELARDMSLACFCFEIHGAGWDKIVPKLERAGAEVRYFPGTQDYVGDYKLMVEAIPHFDYYLYLGLDEGSLGTLDALAAGVPTIITPQGFHVNLPNAITHSFWDYGELLEIFKKLAADRKSLCDAVSELTWPSHVRQHEIIWRALHEGRRADLLHLLGQASEDDSAGYRMVTSKEFHAKSISPRRILSYIGRHPKIQIWRNAIRALIK